MGKLRLGSALIVTAALGGLVACGEPMEGTWRQKDNPTGCGKAEFTSDSDLKGDGSSWIVNTSGNCIQCDFDIEGDDKGDGRYTFDLDFDECYCGENIKHAEMDCDMNDDEDRLDCEFNWSTCVVDGDTEFEKRGD